ncbi:Ribosome assembly protein 1 [Symbiodinium microadriaticum]|uniref:Ribosome assembly protein 1 n=1 Tax=Symbiodinium microadriaticum TaxID=2951 RepID=A0A1Q9CNX2_SYMMI|nr:Ribosome assembly protein 1 [Symbiodinium microadriaticum]
MFAAGREAESLAWPQDNVRNICILAHVDHGKTTCADNLISTNGFISPQSAGKIRYLDSREDEQEREITMKSSSIALRWQGLSRTFLVNLIDSPGHVDFTSEVSTAARLADGALIVIDVVEGVEAQTRTVLRQAYRDRVKSCLFLNKARIVEQINAANQQLFSEEVMAKGAARKPSAADATMDSLDLSQALDFEDEELWRYSPELGNVAFGSAVHGWAFRIDSFAPLIAKKLGAKKENLQKVLWGDWTFNKKTKRAQKRTSEDTESKTMFAEFIMQPICNLYEAAYKYLDTDLLGKMQRQIPGWKDLDLQKLTAGATATRELSSRWLPFADCILEMATSHLPSPVDAAPHRLPVLCPKWFAPKPLASEIADGLHKCDPEATPVAYLAKFLSADLARLVLTDDTLVGDQDVDFVGICRVFSGTLRPNSRVYIGQDKPDEQERWLQVVRLFQLMGRNLLEVTEAPAGSIVACHVSSPDGAELGVERFLTLSGAENGPNFETPYSSQAFAIVRVNLQPNRVEDLKALERGLRLLHRADPSVSIEAMVTGENVLGCCGDEHLKRCTHDLQKLYARDVEFSVSTPLVAVRESIAKSVSMERLDPKGSVLWLPIWMSHLTDTSTEAGSVISGLHSDGGDDASDAPVQHERISMSPTAVMTVWTANRKACIKISAVVLPDSVLEWMDLKAEALEAVIHRQQASVELAGSSDGSLLGCLNEVETQFRMLQEQVEDPGFRICNGCDISLCGMSVVRGSRTLLMDGSGVGWKLQESYDSTWDPAQSQPGQEVPLWMRPNILSGFQLASSAGPLCEEPLRGVAFIIHAAQGAAQTHDEELQIGATHGWHSLIRTWVMVATKEACRYCLLRKGFSRISEAMLTLDVHCEQEMLGKVYAVLGKRRAKVQEEGLREGTSLFYIHAYIPLANSFDLAKDLRQAASGHVSFHCAFSHWELSEEDPFQEASLTPDELEELGDQPLPPTTARKLIDAIRKRKGLPTDEKVVKAGTKQRTVTRMK